MQATPKKVILIGVVLLLPACASRSSLVSPGQAPASTESPPASRPGIDWDNPIGGVLVDSVAEAEASLPFKVQVPRGLGEPERILVAEYSVDPETNVVALVFDTSAYGLVVVTEHLPEVPPEEYDASMEPLLEMNGRPDVHGSFEVISIRGGEKALVTSSEDGSESTIFWLEDGIEFIVKGPNISRANVLQVVEEI